MYSNTEGDVIVKSKRSTSTYSTVLSKKAPVGEEAWIEFNLVEQKYVDKKDDAGGFKSYLVEVKLWGDNSETAIQSSMVIDLIVSSVDEALGLFKKMMDKLTV